MEFAAKIVTMPFDTSAAQIGPLPRHSRRGRVASWGALAACGCVTIAVVGGFVACPLAAACSPGLPSPPTALPRSGSSEVSPATSLVVLSSIQPSQLTLTAGGTNVLLDGVTLLGSGIDGTTGQGTQFWRVRVIGPLTLLPASSELVLSGIGQDGKPTTLTTFTTAAAYDKNDAGKAATVKRLSLRRVRYPVSEINAGGCVFAEYQGYITIEADPAAIPGTPPESVVSTLMLGPKNGGAAQQSITFTGPMPFVGGDFPTSGPMWRPALDPTLEYCASITSFGFNDHAVLPVTSNVVCTTVEQVTAPGAAGAADGCSVAKGASGGGLPLLVLLTIYARRRKAMAPKSTTLASSMFHCT
jgi:hypothetical protein